MSKHPVVLIILDGWGYREDKTHNAIACAPTPQWDEWWRTCPHMILNASGLAVGLPQAQMGNSEVGHMHIGAGRVIMQDLTRINQSIENGTFENNDTLIRTLQTLKNTQKTLHVMGLLSPGGVHSHESHLYAFLQLCLKQHFKDIAIHIFLDGRDTPPQSALPSIQKLEDFLKKNPVGTIVTMTGRYFAMDRDKRWQRIEPLYQLLTESTNPIQYSTASEALLSYYEQEITDEFIPPTPIGINKTIETGDAIFFFNFRADRARELTETFVNPHFQEFNRKIIPKLSHFVSMTQYADYLPTETAFPSINLKNSLGEVLAEQGLTQLRIAETEKYAHVTFFLNGGSELVFTNEVRQLIPSPKVQTYDQKPEMSAVIVTDALVEAIESLTYDVIICNFANADMVGHTGDFEATTEAIQCLDQCLSRIGYAIHKVKGHLLITADHGNAECMYDDHTHQPHTAHTNDPVPLLYVGDSQWTFSATEGSLIDVAPTLLALMNIPQPKEMTGTALLHRRGNEG